MPVKNANTTYWEKYEGPRTNQPTEVYMLRPVTFLLSPVRNVTGQVNVTRQTTRISRVTRIVAGRVGSGQDDFKISRVGSGRVKTSRKSRGWGRVGSRRLENLSRRVGLAKTAQNLPNIFLDIPFRFVSDVWESDICHSICHFWPITPTQGLYKPDQRTTPHARLAPTSVIARDTEDTRCHWKQL